MTQLMKFTAICGLALSQSLPAMAQKQNPADELNNIACVHTEYPVSVLVDLLKGEVLVVDDVNG